MEKRNTIAIGAVSSGAMGVGEGSVFERLFEFNVG